MTVHSMHWVWCRSGGPGCKEPLAAGVPAAPGETVILLLHPPSTFSWFFNRNKEGMSVK